MDSVPDVSLLQIVNPIWNGPPVITRKKAARMVDEGRAVVLDDGRLKFIKHPKNRAAVERAAAGYGRERIDITGLSDVDLRAIEALAAEQCGVRFDWHPGKSRGFTVMKAEKCL